MKKLLINKSIINKPDDNYNDLNSSSKKRFSIKTNKKLIVILVVLIAMGIGTKIAITLLADQGLEKSKYTVLQAGGNITKVNYKGEVKSENSTNVYSNLSIPIKEVKVELGDKVKANDVLAVLDTNKLEKQINELEATISTADASNKVELANAESEYNTALTQSNDENNGDIKNAEVALEGAKLDLENKKKIYENNKLLFENGAISKQDMDTYEISYKNAQNTFDNCTVSLKNIKTKVQQNLTTAKNKYDEARVKAEDKSQHVSIENLKNDLKDAVIIAPVDGIITAKNASVGNPSTGALFEIKDEDNTTVRLDVKEVDIEKIKVGQKAEVKTDSTGADIINGEVVSIQPIAEAEDKSSLTLNNDSNDEEAKFEVKIKITDTNYKLKIGMKAQADIIVDEKDGTYTVPIESIIKDKDNNDCIYIAEKQEKDYVVKQIRITKGLKQILMLKFQEKILKMV